MKKYSKLIWISIFILIALSVIFYWEDMASGFRDGYNAARE